MGDWLLDLLTMNGQQIVVWTDFVAAFCCYIARCTELTRSKVLFYVAPVCSHYDPAWWESHLVESLLNSLHSMSEFSKRHSKDEQ